MTSLLSPWKRRGDGSGRHTRHYGAQGAAGALVQGGVVALTVSQVQRTVEQGASAGRSHGQLVDGSVGVRLGLQVRLRDTATSGNKLFS